MYSIRGKVRKGQQRGKELGFPTANIRLHKSISEGIYVSLAKVHGKEYQSLTFIGAAKTFGQTEVLAETYIFDFNDTIYEDWITVKLLQKIRDNMKFTSANELVKQMNQDKDQARKYFLKKNSNRITVPPGL